MSIDTSHCTPARPSPAELSMASGAASGSWTPLSRSMAVLAACSHLGESAGEASGVGIAPAGWCSLPVSALQNRREQCEEQRRCVRVKHKGDIDHLPASSADKRSSMQTDHS